MDLASVNTELAEIDEQIGNILRALQNGFQKMDKIKDAVAGEGSWKSFLIRCEIVKDLSKTSSEFQKVRQGVLIQRQQKMLHDSKQSMIKDLNSYVALKKQHTSENKRVDLFDVPSVEDGFGEENVMLASTLQITEPYFFGRHDKPVVNGPWQSTNR